LGLPPLIFENRYLSHFQRNAVILVKTDKIGYKQELAPHPDNMLEAFAKEVIEFNHFLFLFKESEATNGCEHTFNIGVTCITTWD
jgi:hypothetical protein